MATAEELLAQMEENPELYADSVGPVNDVIMIDAETRTIELPESEKIFGVESDKASERKYFRCPKIVGDNIDLSTLNLFINFKNANNEGDIYYIDDVVVDGDYITFSWKLSRKVTAYKTDAGKNQLLSFIFCAKNGESPDNEWNTTLCSDGIVLEGLEPGESIAEENADIIQYILERLESAGTITPEQISEAVEEYMASNPIEETDPTVPAWAKEPTKPSYTAEEVGALPNDTKIPTVATETESGTMYPNSSYFLVGADGKLSPKILEELTDDTNSIKFVTAKAVVDYAKSKVSSHNTATDSHNDIRLLIQNLVNTVTALLDSDDETLDQTSEIVAYVKSNKSLIDAITTSKVSVSDIIDNLTTNVANKPLSASQGVVLKGMIDALQTELEGIEIPTTLPNPNSLKIVYGGQEYNYDGSSAIEITIDAGKVERIEKLSTDTAVELEANKLYIFPEMTDLTITFADPTDITAVAEYHFLFQSGATATTLTLPDTVKLPSGFSVDANKVYEISILEGCLCCQSWEVDASA